MDIGKLKGDTTIAYQGLLQSFYTSGIQLLPEEIQSATLQDDAVRLPSTAKIQK